jgi:hypothetical protein
VPPTAAEILADTLCDLVRELTAHRRGSGPHWLMVGDLVEALARHGAGVTAEEIDAAIALCVARHTLKAEGQPVHSVSVWQRPEI